jgi:subtilase family serine protease
METLQSTSKGGVTLRFRATIRLDGKTATVRRLGLVGLAVAPLVGTVMLAAGCGSASSGLPVTSPGPTTTVVGPSVRHRVSGTGLFNRALAFARCMRTRGEPSFPAPTRKGVSVQERIIPGSGVDPNSPQFTAARNACKHLLTNTGLPAPSPRQTITDCLTLPTSPCYTPAQLRVAYGIQPLLDHGITGRGQTVVLPEFPPSEDSPSARANARVTASSDIRKDLARFDRLFGLPAAKLQVVNTLAHASSPWLASEEEVGDTEIVHALAPNAAIREVLIPSPYVTRLDRVSAAVVAALRLALTQGGIVSFSGGTGEQCFTPAEVAQWKSVLQTAQHEHVTVIVSTGDSGAATTACPPETGSATVKGIDLPASDPLALAVGGTSLQANRKTGAYVGETAWNTPASAGGPLAGGGGFSRMFPRPAYQTGIAGIEATRGAPDVAADADPRTGMAIAFSGGRQSYVLLGGGGTSVAAPLWAAVIALANQNAGRDLGFVDPALYRIGRSTDYHRAFHDVTTGTNTVELPALTITGYPAAPGWDPVTGWGSPNAQALVPLLTRYANS